MFRLMEPNYVSPPEKNPFVLDYMKGNGAIAAAGTTNTTNKKHDVRNK